MGLSIADKLKKYISNNGGDPTGAQTIAELVDKLPASGSEGGGMVIVYVNATMHTDEETYTTTLQCESASMTPEEVDAVRESIYQSLNHIEKTLIMVLNIWDDDSYEDGAIPDISIVLNPWVNGNFTGINVSSAIDNPPGYTIYSVHVTEDGWAIYSSDGLFSV